MLARNFRKLVLTTKTPVPSILALIKKRSIAQASPKVSVKENPNVNRSIRYDSCTYSAAQQEQFSVAADKTKGFIAVFKIDGMEVGAKLNRDKRGYRSIVCLVNNPLQPKRSIFNREYSIREEEALLRGLNLLAQAYKKLGLVPQIVIAGNNAHSVEEGVLKIGDEKNISSLHGHVIGRGIPEVAYADNVALRGPEFGKEFHLSGRGVEQGNMSKEQWDENGMVKVAESLAGKVVEVLHSSPELSDIKLVSVAPNAVSEKILADGKEAYRKFLKSASMWALGAAMGGFLFSGSQKVEESSGVSVRNGVK